MNTKKEEYFFLDVREEEEFAVDSIQNSLNMPVRKVLSVGYGFSNGFWESMIPKHLVIVVYCSSGKRANRACEALNSKNYKTENVKTLEEAKKFYNSLTN